MIDRAIARHGYPVLVDGIAAGHVTSGTQTPFLKKAIGMAYVPASTPPDAEIDIDVRSRRARAPNRAAAVLQTTEELTCILPT